MAVPIDYLRMRSGSRNEEGYIPRQRNPFVDSRLPKFNPELNKIRRWYGESCCELNEEEYMELTKYMNQFEG